MLLSFRTHVAATFCKSRSELRIAKSSSSSESRLAKHAQHDTHKGLQPNFLTTSAKGISMMGRHWSVASGVHRKMVDIVHGSSSHRICQKDSSIAINTARVKCEDMYDTFSSFFRRLPSCAGPVVPRGLTKLGEPDASGGLRDGTRVVGVQGAPVVGVRGAPVVGVRGAHVVGVRGAAHVVPGAAAPPLGVPGAPELGHCMGPAAPTQQRRIVVMAPNMMFATSPSIAGPVVSSIVGALTMEALPRAAGP